MHEFGEHCDSSDVWQAALEDVTIVSLDDGRRILVCSEEDITSITARFPELIEEFGRALPDWLTDDAIREAVAAGGETVPGTATRTLDDELASFEELLATGQLDRHRGGFVAVHQGAIVDNDADEFVLAARVELGDWAGPTPICWVPDESGGDVAFSEFDAFESPEVD